MNMLFILEDNDDRIQTFARVLGDMPHHIERTVPQAINWLKANINDINLCSLDNDLYVPEYDGEEGEGWQLCEWLMTQYHAMPIITHTTNSHVAVKMQMMCEKAERDFIRIVPYNGFDWIGESWIVVVMDTLKRLKSYGEGYE